jgi:hypothetical protein
MGSARGRSLPLAVLIDEGSPWGCPPAPEWGAVASRARARANPGGRTRRRCSRTATGREAGAAGRSIWQAVQAAAPHSCVDRECMGSMAPRTVFVHGVRGRLRLRCARFMARPATMRAAGQGEVQGSARAFACARCGVPVLVCRRCDRGQRYCGRECARRARQESVRRAGRRYQGSRAGRFAHARRSLRYRQRRRALQIVTHQGSQAVVAGVTVTTDSTQSTAAEQLPAHAGMPPEATAMPPGAWRCHRCHCACAALPRRGFLRHDRVHRAVPALRGTLHGRPP